MNTSQKKLLRKQKKLDSIRKNYQKIYKKNPLSQAINWNKYLAVSEYKQRRLTFGKYINVKIEDLPNDYLEWGILNLGYEWSEFFIREWKTRNPNWKTIKT